MTDPALTRLTRRVGELGRELVLERHRRKQAEAQIRGLRSAVVRLQAALLRARKRNPPATGAAVLTA